MTLCVLNEVKGMELIMKNKELAEYLKSKKGLHRLINKLREKYISLNRYSGVVKLENITKEESFDISNLLGHKVPAGGELKTSYKEITKKISETKFRDFNWEDLFKYYFNETTISRKENINLNSLNEANFFKDIFNKNKNRKYCQILEKIVSEKGNLYSVIKQQYNRNKENLATDLTNILLLLENIPREPVPLAVYAAITGNPHYLDLNTKTGTLFLKVLSYIKDENQPSSLEDKINLLSEINVYTDPISNYVITYKILGNTILEELAELNEIVNLNLLNILNIPKVYTKNKKAYIFENPSMLNVLSKYNFPIIITSGMPNLSLYKILAKLVESGNELYYNGDFDPEGLLIANKLLEKYPNMKLFCYEKEDYEVSKSSNSLNESRLKKLNSIRSPELDDIKNLLLVNKLAAYQEKNIERIIEFILNNVN